MLPGLAWTVIGQWVYLIVAALLIAHRRYFVSHTFLYGIPSIRNVFLCAPCAADVGQSPSRLGVSHSLVPIRLARREGAVLSLIGSRTRPRGA